MSPSLDIVIMVGGGAGILAWWFWKAAYLTRLVSMRNKMSVAFDWIKVRFFGRNTARIEF